MTDPIDQIRRLDPVDRSAVQISPELAARSLQPPPRRPRNAQVGAAVLLAASLAVVVVFVLSTGGEVSPGERAYAAVTGSGVFHWRTETTNAPGKRQVQEGWASGKTTHVLQYNIVDGRQHLTTDTRTVNDQQVSWAAVSGAFTTGKRPPVGLSPIPAGDPAEIFRKAYTDGRYERTGAAAFRIAFPPDFIATYTADPATGRPLRIAVELSNPGIAPPGAGRTIVDITQYERLDATPENVARLDLLPHGKQDQTADVSRSFAALRRTGRISADEQQQLKPLLRGLREAELPTLDPRAVKTISPGVWLIPDVGKICIASALGGQTVAAGCGPREQAVRTGVVLSGEKTLIAVPDDVNAVEITTAAGETKRVPVHGNLAIAPQDAQTPRLIRRDG